MADSGLNHPIERKDGILTGKQREFLLNPERYYKRQGSKDPENASIQMRSRIRDRIENALYDFEVLNEYLSWRDREHIFAQYPDPEGNRPVAPADDPELEAAVADAIEFLFLGLVRRGIQSSDNWEKGDFRVSAFEEQLEKGLRQAYAAHQLILTNFQLDIEAEWDISQIEYSPDHIESLIEMGIIDEDEHREFIESQVEEYQEE